MAMVPLLALMSVQPASAISAPPTTQATRHAPACGPWMNTKESANLRASQLLKKLSLSQKLTMVHEGFDPGPGYGAAGYVTGIPSLCLPPLFLNDAGSGVADSQVMVNSYPAEIAQAATWNPTLQHQLGASIGAEAHAKGVDVLLAPDLNLVRTPLGGRTSEQYGEDPYLTSEMGDAFIRGVQSQHVIATAKQFVANDQEVNRSSVNETIDQRVLKELYEAPFDAAVTQAKVGAVMCAYNQVNGTHSCQNPSLLTGDLTNSDKFRGFVISDWSATNSAIESANAGLDLEMNLQQASNAVRYLTVPAAPAEKYIFAEMWFGAPLAAAVAAGQVQMSVLNGMVHRILHAMFSVGVFDHPPAKQPAAYLTNVDTPANNQTALSVAEQGSVLLRNTHQILPITGSGKRIAVIGIDAGAGAADVDQALGSVRTSTTKVVSPLSAIRERAAQAGDSVVYDPGVSPTVAAKAAKHASMAIVYVGYSEGESSDLPNLGYNNIFCSYSCVTAPSDANALIAAVSAANPHTVVVLNTGGPALMPWLHKVQGVLEAWYPGEEDGAAAAAILFGDVNPSGKLPVTFPKSLTQSPVSTAAQYPGVNGTMDYSEGLSIGYRWYNANHVTPLFPFGFGLSYSKFTFSGLALTQSSGKVRVRATLANTGRRTGSDVVQVYVSDPASTGEPPQHLAAFGKESVGAGGLSDVSFTLGPRAFSYWDTGSNSWKLAPGCYKIRVGDSSAHEPLSGTIAIGGATGC